MEWLGTVLTELVGVDKNIAQHWPEGNRMECRQLIKEIK